MVKVYVGQGCVSCHKAVKKLLNYVSDVYVERNEEAVSEIVSKTFGVVPVFEHNGIFYNEYQISSMIDEGFNFNTVKDNVIESTVVENVEVIETKVINKKTK